MTSPPATTPSPRSNAPARIATFLDLIKFAHSIFALPFALIAAFWAFRIHNVTRLQDHATALAFILACMVLARTFAMTFNRLVDRHFDALNPRTASRPSVTGKISAAFMHIVLWLAAVAFIALTTLCFFFYKNPWPLKLALPVLAWLAAYSFTKRFTPLCHFWLGISLGLAPVSAWFVIAPVYAHPFGHHLQTILLLAAGVTFWVAGFDILYALQDEDFDRSMNLKSIPAALGRRKALIISRLCHALTIAAFLAVGITGHFHLLYWIGLAFASLTLIVEQSLVKPSDISKVNLAFMTANGLIGLVFGVLAIADTLIR